MALLHIGIAVWVVVLKWWCCDIIIITATITNKYGGITITASHIATFNIVRARTAWRRITHNRLYVRIIVEGKCRSVVFFGIFLRVWRDIKVYIEWFSDAKVVGIMMSYLQIQRRVGIYWKLSQSRCVILRPCFQWLRYSSRWRWGCSFQRWVAGGCQGRWWASWR